MQTSKMDPGLAFLVGPLGGLLVLLAVLTALGGARRGVNAPRALIGGLFFPVTWVVWYLTDTRRLRDQR
jgi:hypothetical protein